MSAPWRLGQYLSCSPSCLLRLHSALYKALRFSFGQNHTSIALDPLGLVGVESTPGFRNGMWPISGPPPGNTDWQRRGTWPKPDQWDTILGLTGITGGRGRGKETGRGILTGKCLSVLFFTAALDFMGQRDLPPHFKKKILREQVWSLSY